MRRLAKSGLALFLISCPMFAAQSNPPQKTTKKPESQKRVVRAEDPLAALLAQAEEALNKKDFAKAEEALKKYLAEKPQDALAHFQLGYACLGLEKRGEARSEFARAAELDPKLAEAHLNLGMLLLDKEPAAAVAPLEKVVALKPEQSRPRFLLGLAYERSGKLEQAIAQYQAAARLDVKNFEAHEALGKALISVKRFAEAEREFQSALALRPEIAATRLLIAETLIAQNKAEEGVAEINKYLESNPEDRVVRRSLALLLMKTGKYDPALAEVERAEAGQEPTFEGLKLRAEIYTRQKKLSEAVETLEKAGKIAPQDAELHAKLGRLWLEKRDFAAAERELLEALRLDARLTDAVRDLGAAYYLGEKYEAALRWQEELAKREAPNAMWWFVRATCYDKLRQKPEAIAAYEKFLVMDQGQNPDHEWQARQRVRILRRELERK
jgi:Flp pilus assembly protein TadD